MKALLKNARVVFMGSPEFALPSLETLAANYEVVGVVTQPDRPAGRGKELKPPPIKILAAELDLEIIQPNSLREKEAGKQIAVWNPDLIVVSAYGQILRPEILLLPKHGSINIHASLLPRWRGAAPIQAAILHGDEISGVSIMLMDEGLDTGPIISQKSIKLKPNETAGSLSGKLSILGAESLADTLESYLAGELEASPQDDEMATKAPMLKKKDGKIDFSQSADDLARQIRAFHPWPGSFFTLNGAPIKIHRAHAAKKQTIEPGALHVLDGFPVIECADGWLVLDEVQAAGKRAMSGSDYLRGVRNWSGNLGSPSKKENA